MHDRKSPADGFTSSITRHKFNDLKHRYGRALLSLVPARVIDQDLPRQPGGDSIEV
jgi:hypothetical protein